MSGSTNNVGGQCWTHGTIVWRESDLLAEVSSGLYTIPMQNAIDNGSSITCSPMALKVT